MRILIMDDFNFMGIDWDIEHHSSPDEFYIESIKINDSEELIGCFHEGFIESINRSFFNHLEKEAKRIAEEDAGQQFLEDKLNDR